MVVRQLPKFFWKCYLSSSNLTNRLEQYKGHYDQEENPVSMSKTIFIQLYFGCRPMQRTDKAGCMTKKMQSDERKPSRCYLHFTACKQVTHRQTRWWNVKEAGDAQTVLSTYYWVLQATKNNIDQLTYFSTSKSSTKIVENLNWKIEQNYRSKLNPSPSWW